MNTEISTTAVPGGQTVAVKPAPQPTHLLVMKPEDLIARVRHIQTIREAVMKENVHYGKPFGESAKDSLWKPGAEVLCVTFGLAPRFIEMDLSTEDEFRISYVCELYTIGTNVYVASGVGECSSNELKYKWRGASCEEEFEATPENKRRIQYKKNRDGDVLQIQQIRTDIADSRNTIRKMSKKRSFVDAVLTATGASDMFEQDIEDMLENGLEVRGASKNGTANGKPIYYLVKVETKTGSKKGGGSWTKYGLHTKSKEVFWTFHESIAQLADQLIADKQPCTIDFDKGQYGNDIKGKDGVKPASIPKDVEPEPVAAATTETAPATEHTTGSIIKAFGTGYKVYPSALEKYIARPKEQWTDDDRARLASVLQNLASGTHHVTDYFPDL
jgi:hypothetical protein